MSLFSSGLWPLVFSAYSCSPLAILQYKREHRENISLYKRWVNAYTRSLVQSLDSVLKAADVGLNHPQRKSVYWWTVHLKNEYICILLPAF